MTVKKQIKKGGYSTNVRQHLSTLWARILWTASHLSKQLKTNNKRKAKKVGKTQAERFVESRSAGLQYAIDVLALAFVLALLFTFINHIAK